jgi:hypothetical protein
MKNRLRRSTARRTGAKVGDSLPDFACFVGAVRRIHVELSDMPQILVGDGGFQA